MDSTQGTVASTTDVSAPPKDADVDETATAAEGERVNGVLVACDSDGGVEGPSAGIVKHESEDQTMEDGDWASSPSVPPATVFQILLKQSPSNIRHKMIVPELCRNFRCSVFSPITSVVRRRSPCISFFFVVDGNGAFGCFGKLGCVEKS